MELTLTEPRSPYLGFYKRVGSIGVTALGVMLLFLIVIQFSHSTTGLGRLDLVVITLGAAVIGLWYYKLRGVLNQLDGKINDAVLLYLCHAANAMACFGYLICIVCLGLHH